MSKEYIDKSALYEKIAQLEKLARNRYLETPSNSPCYSRYMTQLNERTYFKHIIADFPAADVEPVVHCRECKHCDPETHHCDHHMGTVAPLRRKPDDFCSYGERKEGTD